VCVLYSNFHGTWLTSHDIISVCGPLLCVWSDDVGIFIEQRVGRGYVITQRLYAHRSLKSLIVVEVDLERSQVSEPLELNVDVTRWQMSYDFTFLTHDSGMEQVMYDIITFSTLAVPYRLQLGLHRSPTSSTIRRFSKSGKNRLRTKFRRSRLLLPDVKNVHK